MTDFWFGDIAVGLVTDKDTDISKEVVEKNFVNEPVQVYELTPNLESGSYSLVFNEEMHPRSESLSEQRDAVLSMPERHVTEFPVEIGGDKGHVVVDQSNVSITPSQMIDEGDISLRFLEDDTYRAGMKLTAKPINDIFTWSSQPETHAALPSDIQNVDTILPVARTITTSDGDLDLYVHQYTPDLEGTETRDIEYDRPDDYTSGERVGIVRLYGSSNKRIYSSDKSFQPVDNNDGVDDIPDDAPYIGNGLVRVYFATGSLRIDYFLNGQWQKVGEFRTGCDSAGYLSEVSNHQSKLSFPNNSTFIEDISLLRGHPFIKFNINKSGSGTYYFRFREEYFSLSLNEEENAYVSMSSSETNGDYILIRTDTDGSFYYDDNEMRWTGLSEGKDYTFFLGFVPDGFTDFEFAENVYHLGNQRRTMFQR